MTLHVSDTFDSGNITCLSADDPADIHLEIRKDNNSDFYQWFHFRLTGAKGTACVLKIMNAGGAAYTKGWRVTAPSRPPTGKTGCGCRPPMKTAC